MKRRLFLAFLATGIVILGIALLLSVFAKPAGGVLLVDTTPASTVYVDGESAGGSPLEKRFKAREVTVKLVPLDAKLSEYETKLSLSPGVKTVLRREFGQNENLSAGEEMSFEKTGEPGASVSVVTIPDSSLILLDGQQRGFGPMKMSDLSAGEHVLTVTAQGYIERSFSIKTQEGYRLTAVVKLAENPDYEEKEPPVLGNKDALEMVEILSTPTGFLRVRKDAGADSVEIARATPGLKYPLIEKAKDNSWYKIKIDAKEGWVSAKYATVSGEVSQ